MADFEFDITATYSPEDNKIRLYASERLDAETFQRVKAAGFKWAPKQELFVAPMWTVARENLALELAGEIEPEETTLAERAQIKAERLDGIAEKRAEQANAFHRAADELSRAFEFGQPILVGHHSERKARKTQERMHNAMDKAVKAHSAISYWQYRAAGVEAHANMKNDPKVRAGRIKKLLAELRDLQRALNAAHKALAMWESATTDGQINLILARGHSSVPYGLYSAVAEGKTTPAEARAQRIEAAKRTIASDHLSRRISHTLNRLSYEREMLGEVPRFEGEITPTLLQMFVREHGADKPKGKKADDDLFSVECDAPLPAHVANGSTVEMSADEWRDLMQSCGYVPPAKKPAKPPILNFKAASGQIIGKSNAVYRGAEPTETFRQVEMTKAEHGSIRSESRYIRYSACGEFRFRTAPDPEHKGPYYLCPRVAVFITDQKQHDAPASTQEAGADQ